MSLPGRIVVGPEIVADQTLDCDVCIVGSGAGGSVAAAVLAAAGARVVVLEEGGHHTRREFNMRESWAYPTLYQEHGNRATEDLSITILQGRSVGGGTTVNWTSSFRTPPATLALWQRKHAVDVDEARLAPHFAAVEERLSVSQASLEGDVNRNNRVLYDGAAKLGWNPQVVKRNVRGCARLGACGLGCPIDAKQAAHITWIMDAVAAQAAVYANCRVTRLARQGRRITAVEAEVLDEARDRPAGRHVTVRPTKGVILAAGALNTPALLLRSRLPDPSGAAGKRTFLHLTAPILAFFAEPIHGYLGPPLSVSCHHFADRGAHIGYFLETPPIHPMLAALAFPGIGDAHRRTTERLAYAQSTIALLIDGQHDDPGGTVRVDEDGRLRFRYPLGEPVCEAIVDAIKNMARLALAAGATEVVTLHEDPLTIRREADLAAVDRAPMGPNLHTLFSAHQMGGAAMGEDAERAVVDSRGKHHGLDNLWICDGSVFPTSLGVNPQISIYAHARMFAEGIAKAG